MALRSEIKELLIKSPFNMKYQKTNANGDAGEYLLAFKMTRILGWPCRLYGVDLGVDAELEILNSKKESAGDIIKIQIKAVDKVRDNDSVSIYVDDRHIGYWKRFCLPVIVCCVDLTRQNVYWKSITSTETYSTSGQSKKVVFSLTKDLLDQSSAGKLRELAVPTESKQMDALFSRLLKLYGEIPDQNTGYLDYDAIYETEAKCDKVDEVIAGIEELVLHFPWRLSSIALNELSRIKRNVQITRNECSYHESVMANGM